MTIRSKVFGFIWSLAFLLISSFAFSQMGKRDSLRVLLEMWKRDTATVNAFNALAVELSNSNTDTSIVLSEQALVLSEEIDWEAGWAKSHHLLGWFLYLKGNYSNSLEHYLHALAVWEKELKAASSIHLSLSENYVLNQKSKTLGNIGIIYKEQGNFRKALDYYFEAKGIDEKIGNKSGVARHIGNIGLVYWNQGDYPKALEYYFKALKMKEEAGNKNGVAITLGNIGIIYMEQARLGSLPVVRDSLFRKALLYYYDALSMHEQLQNKVGIASVVGNIGSLYSDMGKFREAEEFLKRSISLADSIGYLEGSREYNLSISHLYDTTGRYGLALEHYKRYIVAKDSLASEENAKRQTRMEMQYEFDKKEAAAKAESDKLAAIAQADKRKQQVFLYSVISGLGLVLLFAGFIFRSLRTTRKQKQLIEQQKYWVEEKQKEILDSIHYARRIQTALLPTDKYIEKTLHRLMVR